MPNSTSLGVKIVAGVLAITALSFIPHIANGTLGLVLVSLLFASLSLVASVGLWIGDKLLGFGLGFLILTIGGIGAMIQRELFPIVLAIILLGYPLTQRSQFRKSVVTS